VVVKWCTDRYYCNATQKKGMSGIISTNASLLEEREEREIPKRKHEVISILGELLEGCSVKYLTCS